MLTGLLGAGLIAGSMPNGRDIEKGMEGIKNALQNKKDAHAYIELFKAISGNNFSICLNCGYVDIKKEFEILYIFKEGIKRHECKKCGSRAIYINK